MDASSDAATLLDHAQEKVAVLDADGTFRYLNAAVVEVLGFEPEELVGSDAFDLIHPGDEERVRRLFRELVAGDRPSPGTVEYRYGTADGDWVRMESDVYSPADTGLDGYVLSSRDVTEAVESRRRLESIAANSPDVLWMFRPDWSEVLFVNDAVEDVFGVTVETLEDRPTAFLEAIHPDDRPYVKRSMERLSAGESTELDYRVNRDEEFSRWVRVPAEPIVEGGEVVGIVGVARDVTEEYRRNRQLSAMDTLLRHNIRNDMNVIVGTASLIAEAATGESATRAETICEVGESLLNTAEKQRRVIDLLSQRASPQPLDVEEMLAEAVASVTRSENLPEGTFTLSCPDGVRAFTLPEVGYAISELLSNAVEHADRDPEVDVRVTRTGGTVEIAIRDNCPPIPAEEYRVVTGEREMTDLTHTAGMGLWLVYWVVDRSNGDVRFDTHANGNVVTISLPEADCESA